jgi:hypothetical protein
MLKRIVTLQKSMTDAKTTSKECSLDILNQEFEIVAYNMEEIEVCTPKGL